MPDTDNIKDNIVHAPHLPLTDYYRNEEERRGWVGKMFDSTAADYNRIETILGLGSGSWYRGQALLRAGLKPGMKMVDVGVGTGLVARQAANIVGDPALVTGVDPSTGMLQNAQVPAGVKLVQGTAEQIPFPDNTFDFLSMGYALRHISDLSVAFAEFHRVLKPGGRLCILEITCPEKPFRKMLLKAYIKGVVPTLARLASRSGNTSLLWRYYWDTIEACAAPASVMHTLKNAGFANVDRYLELGVFSEYRALKK
ncbi:MAG TPA: class I SAM-dependent methyltransferase [Paucimonas sp.]|nr:class I SAM-dependent methyltransferase [Paucimonas sp.]HJW54882.1 class I SAM-dependent methyltransferase [Burkholderiaceae bacterium]